MAEGLEYISLRASKLDETLSFEDLNLQKLNETQFIGRQVHHLTAPSDQDYVVHVSNMSSADYTQGAFNPS